MLVYYSGSLFLGFIANTMNLIIIPVFYYLIFLDRYEVYALRDASGYGKFRDKIWKTHKNDALLRGEFS